jgi:uncharacterized protein
MRNGRWLATQLAPALARPYVHVLFGARQTGKSTLLRALLPHPALQLDLSEPGLRARYLARPETFVEECRALPKTRGASFVVVDEAQSVPALFDAVQHLYDEDKRRFRFVLCGSSARKLRRAGANLLPGRSMLHRLFPLVLRERPAVPAAPPSAALLPFGPAPEPWFPSADLPERLAFGDLPGVVLARTQDRAALLRAYSEVYLEEELRREALIKEWPGFARFLRLAALEAGQIVNYAKIAGQAGISSVTVKSHYDLLEDMFVGVRVLSYSGSARKHVLSTPKFLFFDLGVRNAAAGLPVSRDAVSGDPGRLFEQWVGIELWRRLQYLGRGELRYLRTKAGAEVDYVVDLGRRVIPVEVKWTDEPRASDAKHVIALMSELGQRAPKGYVVCRCSRPRQIAVGVTAIPWQAL